MKKKFTIEKGMKCFKCSKEIDCNENYVELNTYNKSDLIERTVFHILCWGEFNQMKVDQRINEMAGMGMGFIKNFLGERDG